MNASKLTPVPSNFFAHALDGDRERGGLLYDLGPVDSADQRTVQGTFDAFRTAFSLKERKQRGGVEDAGQSSISRAASACRSAMSSSPKADVIRYVSKSGLQAFH